MQNAITEVNEPISNRENCKEKWIILTITFISVSITTSIIYSYGVIYVILIETYKNYHVSILPALIGSLALGIPFLITPISGILIDLLGHNLTAIIGGLIATVGMLASSFLINSAGLLCLTFSLMFAGGSSLMVCACVSCTNLYFRHGRLRLINWLITSGGAMFGVILPFLIRKIDELFGLVTMIQIFSAVLLFVTITTIKLKPPEDMPMKLDSCKNKLFVMENFKNQKFILWLTSLPLSTCTLGIIYVYIARLSTWKFPESDGDFLVMCLNFSTMLSRLVMIFIGDRANFITLQQVSIVSSGVLTMYLPVSSNWPILVVLTLALGFMNGCCISMLGQISVQICGLEYGVSGLGLAMLITSLPIIVGPIIVGLIYDLTESFMIPMLLAGCVSIAGGLSMSAIYFFDSSRKYSELDEEMELPVKKHEQDQLTSLELRRIFVR